MGAATIPRMDVGNIWLDALGRLHPVVLHFPLALAVAAAAVEMLAWIARRPAPAASAFVMVLLAAVTAPMAALSGWFNAEFGDDDGDLLLWHRITGIVSTIVLLLVAALAVWARRATDARPSGNSSQARSRVGIAYRTTLLVAALVIGYCGHLGGELKWGQGYTTDRLFDAIRATLGGADPAGNGEARESGRAKGGSSRTESSDAVQPESAPSDSALPREGSADASSPGAAATRPDETLALMDLDPSSLRYEEHLLPMLSTHCAECHMGGRSKGRLSLSRRDPLLSENRSGLWIVREGASDESELLRRVSLRRDDPDTMPPEGAGLSPQEIELLRRWIDAGAQ